MTRLLKALNLSMLTLVTLAGIGSLSAQEALQLADMSGGDSGVDWSISGDFFGFGSEIAPGTEALIQLRAVNSTSLTVGDIKLYFTTSGFSIDSSSGGTGEITFSPGVKSTDCTMTGLASGLSGPIGIAGAPTSIESTQFQEDSWTAITCSILDPSFMAANTDGSDFFVTLGLTGSGDPLLADISSGNKTRLDIFTPTTSAVPEPGTVGFGLVTLAAIGFRQYKRNKNVA